MSVVIYTKPDCPYCKRAMDHYDSVGQVYVEHDAQNDLVYQREMLEFSGGDPTVPCIIKDGRFFQSGWGDPPRG